MPDYATLPHFTLTLFDVCFFVTLASYFAAAGYLVFAVTPVSLLLREADSWLRRQRHFRLPAPLTLRRLRFHWLMPFH
jgi:hypothetical protein